MKEDPFGCSVSCTGLYADVSFSKENFEDTSIALEDMIIDSEVFLRLTKDYKTFKSKFAQNLIFDSTSPSLGTQYKHFLFSIHCPSSSLSERRWNLLRWDLLWHLYLWRGGTGQEDDSWGPTWPCWGNDGSPHWVLHPQWGRDHLLRHQVLCLTQGKASRLSNGN